MSRVLLGVRDLGRGKSRDSGGVAGNVGEMGLQGLVGNQLQMNTVLNVGFTGVIVWEKKEAFHASLLNTTKSKTNKPRLPGRRVRDIRNLDAPPTTKKLNQIHNHQAFKKEMVAGFNSISTIRAQDTLNVDASVRKVSPSRKLIKEHRPKKNIILDGKNLAPSSGGG
uniref:Uncharacterized protein n=1 Tax=Tanacetum cinerariifolium TaxID=118510 RepID=A0A699HIB4_TANCI|nr:hypothetical protein [Tanacetum cinerariifolium]